MNEWEKLRVDTYNAYRIRRRRHVIVVAARITEPHLTAHSVVL